MHACGSVAIVMGLRLAVLRIAEALSKFAKGLMSTIAFWFNVSSVNIKYINNKRLNAGKPHNVEQNNLATLLPDLL